MTDALLDIIDTVREDAPAVRENDLELAVIQEYARDLSWYVTTGKAAIAQGEMIAGSGWVAPATDPEHLRDAIAYVVERDGKVGDFVGAANNRIEQLQEREA